MTASPPAGGAATPTPHAAELAAALEVDCIPPGTTNADLAALFGPFCSIDKVVTVFEHASCSGSGSGGSALLLLPPSGAAKASALAAAKALNGHQLGGSSLDVRVCSSPAAWLQRALGPQLLAGGTAGLADAAQRAQHAPGERACGSGDRVPQADGPPGERVRSQPGGSLCPSCAPAGSGHSEQLENTLEEQPSELEGLLEEQPSSGSLESLPPDFRLLAARSSSPSPTLGFRALAAASGGSGSGSLSPHGGQLRRRGSSLAGSVGSEGSATDGTIVVHNLPAYLSAREIGEFFMQFGEVGECHKPQGAAFAFVQYLDAAGAVRAKEAVHYKLVPQLNPNEALSIQFGKQLPSSRSSTGRGPPTTDRGSSDGGSLEGSVADGGGQALVVTNLDPGVSYKDVRAFFARFGKVQSCYRQPQTRFAFITYAAPEAAVEALQAVDGSLCPELNPSGLIAAEYRRGVGARQSCDGGGGSHTSHNPALTFHPHVPPAGQPGFPGAPPVPPAAFPAGVVFAPFPPGSPGAGLPPGAAAWGAAAWPGAWPAGWPSPRSGPR